MRDIGAYRRGACVGQRDRGVAQGAGGIDDIVNQDAALTFHIADNVHHFGNTSLFTPLVDNSEVGIDASRDRPGTDHPTHIGGDDNRLLIVVECLLDVAAEDARDVNTQLQVEMIKQQRKTNVLLRARTQTVSASLAPARTRTRPVQQQQHHARSGCSREERDHANHRAQPAEGKYEETG